MQTKATLPIHELSVPITDIEIEPGTFKVTNIYTPLPIVIEVLKGNPDEGKARQLIAEYANTQYKQKLDPTKIAIRLCLIAWHEGDPNNIEAKRLYAIRRRLKPFFSYKGKMGEIWLDANTMKILEVRENPYRPVKRLPRPRV